MRDQSAVTVLRSQPLAVLLRLERARIVFAGFTPDSLQLVLVYSDARSESPLILFAGSHSFERWSVADSRRVEQREVPLRECDSWVFSPDGGTLACVDSGGTLRLIAMSSDRVIFEKKRFGNKFVHNPDGNFTDVQRWGWPGSAEIHFSPDSGIVIAKPFLADGSPIAWDLRQEKAVRLQGRLRQPRGLGAFCFVSPNRVLTSPEGRGKLVSGEILDFPSGQVLSHPKIPPGQLAYTTDSRYVIIRSDPLANPVTDLSDAVGVIDRQPFVRTVAVDYRTGEAIVSDTAALDVFGSFYVAELRNGDVGLYERGRGLQSVITISSR